MISSYEYWLEYYRVVGVLYATETGLYRELPTSAGSYATLNVVYRICFVDRAGRIRVQDFDNKSSMDKDDKVGGQVTLDGINWFVEEPNEGAFTLDCKTVYSSLRENNPKLYILAGHMHAQADGQEHFLP